MTNRVRSLTGRMLLKRLLAHSARVTALRGLSRNGVASFRVSRVNRAPTGPQAPDTV